MSTYIYDNSFNGFLTAVFWAYKDEKAEIKSEKTFDNLSFFETFDVNTEEKLYKRVWDGLNGISREFLYDVYYAFLSDTACENDILAYIRKGFLEGNKIRGCYNIDTVKKIMVLRNKVAFESHRIKGLLRFAKLKDNIYIGDITPDHDIITILAPHFALRLAQQKWIIRDLKRKTAAVYDKGSWGITELSDEQLIKAAANDEFETLWKEYFKNIAIKERINPKLQRKFVPVRYRGNMLEFEG